MYTSKLRGLAFTAFINTLYNYYYITLYFYCINTIIGSGAVEGNVGEHHSPKYFVGGTPYVEQSICCAVSIYFSGQFR